MRRLKLAWYLRKETCTTWLKAWGHAGYAIWLDKQFAKRQGENK